MITYTENHTYLISVPSVLLPDATRILKYFQIKNRPCANRNGLRLGRIPVKTLL
nr:MAG TPA: hypothetical protein [Caudoviricetes sp.]